MTEDVLLTPESTADEILALIRALDDHGLRTVNERHGNDLGIKMAHLRTMAKQLKTNHELGLELWAQADTAAQLLALLLVRPRQFSAEEVDELMRTARAPRVREWTTNYVAKKSKHLEELRLRWMEDANPFVRGAGWDLTAHVVVKSPESLDLDMTLAEIQRKMGSEEDPVQWGMNSTLAHIGIEFEEYREQALRIGQELGVFKDYPTSPGCTSPYAPIWITEMVARKAN